MVVDAMRRGEDMVLTDEGAAAQPAGGRAALALVPQQRHPGEVTWKTDGILKRSPLSSEECDTKWLVKASLHPEKVPALKYT